MPYTILAIDDTKKILDIIKYFLEQEGHTVKTASDPLEGLKVAKADRIDLILLDIMMPGMDGYTLFDHLKKDPKTRDIPVIMLTAKAIIMHTPKDFFYGLYGFLAKPFSKQQLVKMTTDILRMTKSKEETQFLQPLEGEGGQEEATK